jgi:GNAT superfamily N-acetyltransferase
MSVYERLKMSIEIRLAKIEEKDLIKKALIEYSRELSKYERVPSSTFASAKYFDDYWIDENRFPIIAWKNEKLIGICLLRDDGERYSIAEFYVKPLFRRFGYGRRIVKFIEEFCVEQGKHEEICANNLHRNFRAKVFWNAVGFETKELIEIGNEKFLVNVKKLNPLDS